MENKAESLVEGDQYGGYPFRTRLGMEKRRPTTYGRGRISRPWQPRGLGDKGKKEDGERGKINSLF